MHSTIRAPRPFTNAPRLASNRTRKLRVRASLVRGSSCSSECSTSGSDNLWWRTLATLEVQKVQPAATIAVLVLGMAATAGAASAADFGDIHVQPLADLAEEDILTNLGRYARYFVSVMLGTGYVMLRPLQSMFKRPVTAILGIVAIVALVLGIRVALELMLGINEYQYNPDNFQIVTQY